MLRIISAQRMYDPDAPGEIEELPEEVDLPIITPDDMGEYIEPEQDEEEIITEPPEGYGVQETFLDEIPEVFQDEQDLIQEAIEDRQCITFEYTTRKGKYAGFRIVEPYGYFTAGTGNEILVTWDRTRSNIRAFIIDNIHANSLKIMHSPFYRFVQDKFVFNPY